MTVLAERPMTISPTASSGHARERRDELVLAALPSAVNMVRLLVNYDLADWSFDNEFIGRVEQVAVELARHAVAPTAIEGAALSSELSSGLRIIVARLRAFDDRVIVEMWDQSNAPPDPDLGKKPAIAAAESWSYEFPEPGRRVLSCDVAVLPALPRRTPSAVPPPTKDQPDSTVDTGLMQRILDGLRRNEPTGH